MGFVVIKYFEWSEKIAAGLTIETNNFFMYYYVMTGIHLIHISIKVSGVFPVLSFPTLPARDGLLHFLNYESLKKSITD